MNCLLKCSAFCLSVVAVLLSKVMVMFGVCGGFLCAVFILWSQLLYVMCCFQSACLWFCNSLYMFVFCCARSGSLGFCCLVVLRCFNMSLMCTGSSLCTQRGVFSLSLYDVCLRRVWRWLVFFVAVCAFCVVSVFASVCSISCVNSCQFALL